MSEESSKKPGWDKDKADMLRPGAQPLVSVPQAPPVASPGVSAEEQRDHLRKAGMIR